ncbi:ABC transporter permease [Bacillus sp. V3B]|uniref:ABC transporter permease n=1 Tax=Bacillus sp. V3B TaxID=2804915 RepID=UPI00210E7898|nr:ABC transporter permease [Bacillus sp. V3B]MCQ6277093.1 ABC transporter permease [Bacillus sp. V3B]
MRIMIGKLKRMIAPGFFLLFMIPLAASILLGSFLEKQQTEWVIPIGFVDEDQSVFSKKVIEQMKKQEMLVINEVSSEDASTLLERNEVDSVFVIKPRFQEHLLKEEREAMVELWTSPTSVASGIVQEVVASEVTKMTSAIKASNRVMQLYERKQMDGHLIWQEAYDYTLGQWEPEPLMTIHYVQENGSQEVGNDMETEKGALFVPYLGIWSFFTMISCFMMSDWVVKERSVVFSRIMTTYKGLSSYLFQTACAFLLVHSGQALLSFWILSHFGWMERELSLFVGMILFLVFSISLSVWLASFIRHLGSYYVASILVAFILAISGGSFFPITELSPALATLSEWLPQQLLRVMNMSEMWRIGLTMMGGSFLFWKWTVWRLRLR